MTYCTGSHTKFYHRFHVVWITKYRYKVLHGEMRERLRDIIRQTCAEMDVQIIKGVLSSDHVHMFVSIPPHLALSTVMQRIKGRTSRKILQEFQHMQKQYWGRHFWARGYFVASSGNVTDEAIMEYIKHQDDTIPGDGGDNFRVS